MASRGYIYLQQCVGNMWLWLTKSKTKMKNVHYSSLHFPQYVLSNALVLKLGWLDLPWYLLGFRSQLLSACSQFTLCSLNGRSPRGQLISMLPALAPRENSDQTSATGVGGYTWVVRVTDSTQASSLEILPPWRGWGEGGVYGHLLVWLYLGIHGSVQGYCKWLFQQQQRTSIILLRSKST
jgi:hypothetical protein